MLYIHNGILFSYKKEENPTICNNMDGPWGHYTKWNKPDIEKQILYDFTYTWNLKKQKTKLAEKEIRSAVIRGEAWRVGWGNWMKIVERYKLSVIR